MKKVIVLLTSLFIIGQLIAQDSPLETKGTKYFELFTFSKAIESYEKLGAKNLTTEGLRNLAEAYRYRHNELKAEEYYSILVTKSDNKAEDLFMYAEMLLMNGKVDDSEKWMQNFYDRLSSDGRGEEYVSNKGAYQKLRENIGRFSIAHLSINTAKEDFGPAFYGEKVVFASSRENLEPIKRKWNWNNFPFLNIYEAIVNSEKKLEKVEEFNKSMNRKYHEGPASFSADGNLMVFTSNNYKEKSSDGEVKLEMFYREKEEGGEWGDAVAFEFNNKEYSVGQPALSGDGKTLYFVSNMPGGKGGTDLYKVERRGEGGWSSPEILGGSLNTEGNEMFPFIHESGMFFFASNGHVGLGGLDIFVSKLEGGKFNDVQNLGYPVNDSKDDFGLILDKSQKYGFFSSNRPGGKGSDDIYGFDLLKPLVFCKEIKGIVKDTEGDLVSGVEVVLINNKGKEVERLVVGEDGGYSFCVEPGTYKITGSKENYFDVKSSAKTSEESAATKVDLVLEKDPGFGLYGIITDSRTKDPLENVNVLLLNKLTGEEETIITPASGDFLRALPGKKLNDKISYDLLLTREGYFSKQVNYSKVLLTSGTYNIHEKLDLSLDKEVKDLSELIDINPINFDLNKDFIRPDAKVELDKIVEVMNKYSNMVVELGSHTDCRGSRRYNESLSDRRAKSSATYIKSKITNPERIYGKGYGEELLLNGCACEGKVRSTCSEDEHEKNRRTEFKVISTGNDKLRVQNNSTDSFEKE